MLVWQLRDGALTHYADQSNQVTLSSAGFGCRVPTVRTPSRLELRDGEWLALTGDNGAGKINAVTDYGSACFPHFRPSGTLNGEPIAQLLKHRTRRRYRGVLFLQACSQIFLASNVVHKRSLAENYNAGRRSEILIAHAGRAAVMLANGRRRGNTR